MKTRFNLRNLYILMLISIVLFLSIYQPSIHNATIEDLSKIEGISTGYKDEEGIFHKGKAQMIVEYAKNNPNCRIEDLANIKGVGPLLIQRLDKKYR